MTKLTTISAVRIATAGGEASFSDSEGSAFSNDIGRGWANLPEGTEVELCAAFPKTHTWMVTLTVPQEDEDVVVLTQGAILRKASFDKLCACSASILVEPSEA